jgi:hypothetical protein
MSSGLFPYLQATVSRIFHQRQAKNADYYPHKHLTKKNIKKSTFSAYFHRNDHPDKEKIKS